MQINESLYTILLVLSLTLFEKIPLYQALVQGSYKTEVITTGKAGGLNL